MIQSVEKKYSQYGDFLNYYVVFESGFEAFVPHDTANRHYQEILEWVAEGNTITDNGGSN